MSEQDKAVVRRYYEEVLNRGNLAEVDTLMAPSVVMNGHQMSSAGIRDVIASSRVSFPDLQYKLEGMVAEGDTVAVRWSWHGTHQGVYRGAAPTWKKVNCTGMGFWRLENGKIAEHWSNIDRFGVLQQLGLV
jgi:steroid delta-isomerase-like uncharacterized protein